MDKENQVFNEGLVLAQSKWKKYTEAIVDGFKKKYNKEPEQSVLATTAMMLENTQKMMKKMDETTKVVNLGNFVDYGFGVITAVMPALVAHEIVSVQPLKARTGEIFYLDFKYGSNKGNIAKGTSMLSPFTGPAGNAAFTSETISGEELGNVAASETAVTFEKNLSYLPVKAKSVEISDGLHTYVDDGAGKIEVSGTADANFISGTVDYATGHVEIKLSKLAAAATYVANYGFSLSNQDVGATIPEVDIELASTSITTTTRKLRARWLFDSAFELQQTHGIDAEVELTTALASEVRHEIDMEIMNDLLLAATAGGIEFSWSKTAPTGVSYVDYKDTFVDKLIMMSNAIFQETKRAEGNFIIAGIDVCSVIESLGSRFVPVKDGMKAGPHVVGILDGRWKVIKNPFYAPTKFLVGYKGQSYLEGGYIYAPYLPVYTTPTVMLDDFVNRKGCATRYGKKILNTKFYAKGCITA